MFKSELGLKLLAALLTAVIVISFVLLMLGARYLCGGLTPVRVFVDDQLVYSGNSSCVQAKSQGAATQLTIRRHAFLCAIAKSHYVSNQISIEPYNV